VPIDPNHPSLRERLAKIRLLVTDVDGVMTDGLGYYDDEGMRIRAFSMRDGFGFVMAKFAGIELGIISGNQSGTVNARMKKFGVTRIKGGHFRKTGFFKEILDETGIEAAESAYIGDDLFDLPVMRLAGVSFAPADAHEVVRGQADGVTFAHAGFGVVREVIEAIIKAKGLWDKVLEDIEKDEKGGLG